MANDLVRRAEVYDLAVGIVSGFQFLFTEQAELSADVEHFERYPKVVHGDGNDATPDFTVLFKDGSALVGEIAQLPLADQGVDSICQQLQRYATLPAVPASPSATATPTLIDQLLIVKHGTGTAAVNRIIRDRLDSPDHLFNIEAPPCIVSAAPTDSGYTFERRGSGRNGNIREEQGREGINSWFMEGDINLGAKYFENIKAQWVFANDEIDALYLATHLWAREFPTMAEAAARLGRDVPVRFPTADLASSMREKYGRCNVADLNRAMSLLERGKFARRINTAEWEVVWGPFQQEGNDLRKALAARAESPPREGTVERFARATRAQTAERERPPTLWDALEAEAEPTRAATKSRPPKPGARESRKSASKKAKPGIDREVPARPAARKNPVSPRPPAAKKTPCSPVKASPAKKAKRTRSAKRKPPPTR